MDTRIDYNSISQMLSSAHTEGRDFLFEYEVYSLLSRSGAETPPQCSFIPKGAVSSDKSLGSLPGDKVVLKVVSPYIVHKTEAGGVKIVENETNRIRSALRRMLYEVPENYAAMIEANPSHAPAPYRGLSGKALVTSVSKDIQGILQVQFMPPDSTAFGNELIVGLRHTREFGTIISAGLGGTDTELYAARFRKGQAIVAASVHMGDGQSFFRLFCRTISYKKLAGLTRGQRRIVTDEQLIECFDSFIRMGRYYSQTNTEAPFIIEELEINPFAFCDYLMVPLDGLCRFSIPSKAPNARPVHKINNLLHPETIGIIGVSAARKNFGRIILENILAQGFDRKKVVIFREGEGEIDGVSCLPNLNALENKTLDLFIVAVGAKQVPGLVDEVISQSSAHTVMLIPGAMGETKGSKDKAMKVAEQINSSHASKDGGPIFLGANCMGVVSRPGGYDTWFIPEQKFPKKLGDSFLRMALISQSGAFMLHRAHQSPHIRPAYMISMGNQTDLTLGDMIKYFISSEQVDVIAVYAEGFNDLDGLEFCTAVRKAVLAGKEVVFYKAGRTAEGKAATSSHTASLAGDYMVCESCVRQAGAIVTRTFTEFQEVLFIAETMHGKTINGNRLAAVSGAGFEAVGMADSIQSDDFLMELADLGETSCNRILEVLKTKRLDSLVTIKNPLDINPAADDEVHFEVAQILIQDKGVDAVIVSLDPLSPAMKTLDRTDIPAFDMHLENGILKLMGKLVHTSAIPVVAIVDGGRLYDPLREALTREGIPVFTVCDRAVAALALYIQGRLSSNSIRMSDVLSIT